MQKRRTKNESFENMNSIMTSDKVDVVVGVDSTTAKAYDDNQKAEECVEEVKKELDDKAKEVVTSDPETGKEVKNEYTAKLVLDESLADYEAPKVADGRANKVYENDYEDPHLDYDMFDFIYGLVTDSDYKPLNPLDHRLRKFMYVGSDDYLKTNSSDGHNQVAVTGDSIEVYANEVESFDDIKAICDLYEFTYSGPEAKRSGESHWNFSFTIDVPVESSGYPMMVDEYFESLGMTLEDVMPAAWCKQYRKKINMIEQEAQKIINDKEVERILNKAIMDAARDGDSPLKVYLNRLYKDLDAAGLTYGKTKIRNAFNDAFNDDEDDMDEGIVSNLVDSVKTTVGNIVDTLV